MTFVTDRSALLGGPAAAVRIVSPRTAIPILSNVLIAAEGDAITVTTDSLDMRVASRVPADVERSNDPPGRRDPGSRESPVPSSETAASSPYNARMRRNHRQGLQ